MRSELDALPDAFRARALADHARGRADRAQVWWEAAGLAQDALDDAEPPAPHLRPHRIEECPWR